MERFYTQIRGIRRVAMLALLCIGLACSASAQSITVQVTDAHGTTQKQGSSLSEAMADVVYLEVKGIEVTAGSVTAADWDWLKGIKNQLKENLQRLAVAEGVPTAAMPNECLRECKGLEEVKLMGITEIGEYAFYKCSALKDVAIPMVEEVKNHAFYDCESLKNIEIPKVKTLGGHCLGWCENLRSLKCPRVETMGSSALNNAKRLRNLFLGATPPEIKDYYYPFSGCPSPRYLILADPDGKPLEGAALTAAKNAYGAQSQGGKWHGWIYLGLRSIHSTYTSGKEHVTNLPEFADKGATITLTVDKGYRLKSLTVHKAGDPSTKVSLTAGKDNQFTMPDFDVEATVEVVPITYTVVFENSYYSHPKGTMNPQTFFYDEEKALDKCAFTWSGHTFKGWGEAYSNSVTYTDGQVVKNLSDKEGAKVKLFALWEAAPQCAVNIETKYLDDNYLVRAEVVITKSDGEEYSSWNNPLYQGEVVTVTVKMSPISGDGWKVVKITLNGQEINDGHTFTVGTEDVNIVVTLALRKVLYLAGAPYDGGQLVVKDAEGKTLTLPIELPEGTEVTVLAYPKEGYWLRNITFNGNAQKVSYGTTKIKTVKGANQLSATFEHELRRGHVLLPGEGYPAFVESVVGGSLRVTIGGTEVKPVGASWLDFSKWNAGKEVSIVFLPQEGYRPAKLIVMGETVSISDNKATWTLRENKNEIWYAFTSGKGEEPNVDRVESLLLASTSAVENPFTDRLLVEGAQRVQSYHLLNAAGQSVYRGTHSGSERLEIATSGLPAGLYLLWLQANDGTKVLMVIKQ